MYVGSNYDVLSVPTFMKRDLHMIIIIVKRKNKNTPTSMMYHSWTRPEKLSKSPILHILGPLDNDPLRYWFCEASADINRTHITLN